MEETLISVSEAKTTINAEISQQEKIKIVPSLYKEPEETIRQLIREICELSCPP